MRQIVAPTPRPEQVSERWWQEKWCRRWETVAGGQAVVGRQVGVAGIGRWQVEKRQVGGMMRYAAPCHARCGTIRPFMFFYDVFAARRSMLFSITARDYACSTVRLSPTCRHGENDPVVACRIRLLSFYPLSGTFVQFTTAPTAS